MRSTRGKRVLSAVASVVILALVMLAVSALGEARKDSRADQELANKLQSEKLADQATAAYESGDTTRAAGLVATAARLDPNNPTAQRLAVLIEKSRSSTSGQGSSVKSENDPGEQSADPETDPKEPADSAPDPKEPTTDPDAGFKEAGLDLLGLLPETFDTFSMGQLLEVDAEAAVSASPESPREPISRIVWTVREMDSSANAAQFISKTSKELYDKNAQSVTIDGASAYFGTDGTRYATVVYVRGIYVFEVLATTTGAAPESAKATAVKAAISFSDGQ